MKELHPLQRVLNLIENHSAPMVVFDIDSTIMNTSTRNFKILQEAAKIYREIAPFLTKLDPIKMGWNVMDDLRIAGYKNESILAKIADFWKERFFTDDFVLYDIPYPNVANFITKLYDSGAVLYYLTGRDLPNMSKGTIESFTIHGLPVGDRTIFHFKPNFEMPDFDFKKEAFSDIKNHKLDVLAIFENDPANANIFKEHFPDAEVFLIDTVTPPNPPLPRKDLILFDSWDY